ncbi:MAG TPA: WYL domain-containing protein [Thiotrichales bacterium]|uniref:helix-turn-helix transcriptional regulator n=1 Tax=Polynucleobacter sp. 35-46-11 TaxID=1970425 RepID=UPI0025F2FE61|nr:WYL domain-containing protein [Polynucleobacter sp. 35-46-11]HQR82736.1 WYL domain-containing protein [Thiotrichales bacterium]HQS03978.1 WYL domain-containing protein [Halothiobacillus sp.]
MSNENKDHDRLAVRLTQILIKLNQGEELDPALLAAEFSVHRRTILRDLNERFAYLPLEKNNGRYKIAPAYLGRITFCDIERFAGLAGLRGLYPALNTEFLRELFDSRLQESLLVHGHSYEEMRNHIKQFRQLQQAIIDTRIITIDYCKNANIKTVTVQPYKLINNKGIWYLAATDLGKPKAYTLSKINQVVLEDVQFTPDKSIKRMVEQEDSIWLNQNKTEVILKIEPAVAEYFRRRKLIAGQVIEKELSDGGLLVSGKFGHPNQILPIVRYWIPHVRIVSPESWQNDADNSLIKYLERKN